jgi:hypothetical protein
MVLRCLDEGAHILWKARAAEPGARVQKFSADTIVQTDCIPQTTWDIRPMSRCAAIRTKDSISLLCDRAPAFFPFNKPFVFQPTTITDLAAATAFSWSRPRTPL